MAQLSWSLSAAADPDNAPSGATGLALVRTYCDASLAQGAVVVNLRAGDMALVSGATSIRYPVKATTPAQLLDFGHTRLSMQIARGRKLNPTVFDRDDPLAVLLRSLWSSLEQVQHSGLLHDQAGRQLMDMVVGLTTRLLDRAMVNRLSHYSSATLARAKIEIDLNFADPLFTVTTLASKMRLSSRRLLSLFTEEGTTTSGRIQERRLQHARDLLADPDSIHLRIASIALASGFRDQAYFSRCFRRMFGVTPKHYRDGCSVMSNPHGKR